MKAKLFLLGAIVAGVMLTDANAQTDTTRNKKSKTDTTNRSQRNKKDSSWNRSDTLGKRDTGWQRNRRDSGQELNNREAHIDGQNDNSVAVITADWPAASRRAAEEMREKYGEPDMASEELVVWKDKGNWEMIIISKDEKQRQLSAKELDRLRQAEGDRPDRNDQ